MKGTKTDLDSGSDELNADETGQGHGDISADSDRSTVIGLVPSEPILNGR